MFSFLRKMSCLTDNGNFMKNNSINIIGVRKKGISLHCYKANAMLCYLCCCLIFFYRFSSKETAFEDFHITLYGNIVAVMQGENVSILIQNSSLE